MNSSKFEESVQIFLSISFGILVGGLIGWKIMETYQLGHYLIWVSMIIGSLVGATSFRFGQVLSITKKVWFELRGWQPDYEWWRSKRKSFIHNLNACSVVSLVPLSFFIVLPFLSFERVSVRSVFAFGCMWLIVTLFESSFFTLILEDKDEQIFDGWELKYNLLTLPFYIFFWTVKCIPLMVIEVGKLMVELCKWVRNDSLTIVVNVIHFWSRFLWRVFELTHSAARVVVFIYSGLGTLLAFYLGYGVDGLLAAMLVGGACGVISHYLYHLILSLKKKKAVTVQ